MVQFFGTTYVIFYTDRKNDTLRNETNSIKEQERMGNIQGTGNIMGTILGYIIEFPPFFILHIYKEPKDVLWAKPRIHKVILISIPEVETGICSVFGGDDADGRISNIRVVLLEPLDNATDASAMVFPDSVRHALIFGRKNC